MPDRRSVNRIGGVRERAGDDLIKRKDVTPEALRGAAMRSTRASAALEGRSVPDDYVRSDRVKRFLAEREAGSPGVIESDHRETPLESEKEI